MRFLLGLEQLSMMTLSSMVRIHPQVIVRIDFDTVRHLPPLPGGQMHNLPRPVVIDSRLRLPTTCKLLANYQAGRGRRPWVFCTPADDLERRNRLEMLEKAGARVIQVPIHRSGRNCCIYSCGVLMNI